MSLTFTDFLLGLQLPKIIWLLTDVLECTHEFTKSIRDHFHRTKVEYLPLEKIFPIPRTYLCVRPQMTQLGFFSQQIYPTTLCCSVFRQSGEVHQTGTFEWRSTDWATGPRHQGMTANIRDRKRKVINEVYLRQAGLRLAHHLRHRKWGVQPEVLQELEDTDDSDFSNLHLVGWERNVTFGPLRISL